MMNKEIRFRLSDHENRIIDWFAEHYIEERDECYNIIVDAVVKSACSFQNLYEACAELVQSGEQIRLSTHIDILKGLSNYGITGGKAVELLHKLSRKGAEASKAGISLRETRKMIQILEGEDEQKI